MGVTPPGFYIPSADDYSEIAVLRKRNAELEAELAALKKGGQGLQGGQGGSGGTNIVSIIDGEVRPIYNPCRSPYLQLQSLSYSLSYPYVMDGQVHAPGCTRASLFPPPLTRLYCIPPCELQGSDNDRLRLIINQLQGELNLEREKCEDLRYQNMRLRMRVMSLEDMLDARGVFYERPTDDYVYRDGSKLNLDGAGKGAGAVTADDRVARADFDRLKKDNEGLLARYKVRAMQYGWTCARSAIWVDLCAVCNMGGPVHAMQYGWTCARYAIWSGTGGNLFTHSRTFHIPFLVQPLSDPSLRPWPTPSPPPRASLPLRCTAPTTTSCRQRTRPCGSACRCPPRHPARSSRLFPSGRSARRTRRPRPSRPPPCPRR